MKFEYIIYLLHIVRVFTLERFSHYRHQHCIDICINTTITILTKIDSMLIRYAIELAFEIVI